ncbi:hypothetical protein G9A89_009521 [Geosiphon pyriformis]|nr:hypothetical protein G9A89_009521 [Geosiphon pyriformis]
MNENNLTITNLLQPQSPNDPHSVDSKMNYVNGIPSIEGEDNKTPVKRKRLTQACDACRKKKVKCSGEKPTCQNCQRLSTACTYIPSTKKRGPRVGLVESLEKRLQQMEKLLQPLKHKGLVPDSEGKSGVNEPSAKKPRLSSDQASTLKKEIESQKYENYNSLNTETMEASNVEFSFPIGKSYDSQNSLGYFKLPDISDSPSPTFPQATNNPMDSFLNAKGYQPTNNRDAQLEISNFLPQTSLPPSPPEPPIMQPTPTTPIINQFPKSENHKNLDFQERNNQNGSNDILLFLGDSSAKPGFHTTQELFQESLMTSNSATTSSETSRTSLPSQDIVIHLAQCYFRFQYKQMPIFHEETFMHRLRENKVSQFLMFALCAATARFSDHPEIVCNPPYLSGDIFAEIVKPMVLDSWDQPSVEHVQAFLFMSIHEYGRNQGPRAWMYIGSAVRMAQELGLYKEFEGPSAGSAQNLDSEAAFIEREVRRRTFWCCFIVDRFSAAALGRPTIIDEADIEIRLPLDAGWENPHVIVSDTKNGRLTEVQSKIGSKLRLESKGSFATFVSVAALLGRVARKANRSTFDDSQPWNTNSDYNLLAREADEWYESLDPNIQWPKEKPKEYNEINIAAEYVSINLLYHAAVIILNRPHLVLLHKGIVPSEHMEFFQESSKRCSRSAQLMSEMVEVLLNSGLYFMCPFTVYPIFASGTIHINNMFKGDKDISELAKRYFKVNMQYLTVMEPFWGMGGKFKLILSEMYRQHQELGEITCPFAYCDGEDRFSSTVVNSKIQFPTVADLGSDLGLMEFWNCATFPTMPRPCSKGSEKREKSVIGFPQNLSIPDLSLETQSYYLGDILSPRSFMNDTYGMSDSWLHTLRSSSTIPSITPRTLRINKKDPNDDNDYSMPDDYFSQDMTLYNSNINAIGFSFE